MALNKVLFLTDLNESEFGLKHPIVYESQVNLNTKQSFFPQAILRKNKARKYILRDFKTHCRVTLIKTV